MHFETRFTDRPYRSIGGALLFALSILVASQPHAKLTALVPGQPCSGQTSLQACANTLERWVVPPGTYYVDSPIVITRPIEIVAYGAVFVAHPALKAPLGMIYAGYMSGVTIRGLTLDGNKAARPASGCDGGKGAYGYVNLHLDNVDDVVLDSVTTKNATCGSGAVIKGKRISVSGSHFLANGSTATLQWADGLTLLGCEDCDVTGNVFQDNTDLDLVFGGGRRTVISGNVFRQRVNAFAAIGLDNFNGTQSGDFSDTLISDNAIDCGDLLCDFGLSIGPHAWYGSPNIQGGSITRNVVRGAKIGILAEGAGTQSGPTAIVGNLVSGTPACGTLQAFFCGSQPVCGTVYSPDSVLAIGSDGPGMVADHSNCP